MRIKNFTQFITEAAVSMKDILLEDQGILFNKWTRLGKLHVAIILYDFKAEKILGYIEMEKTNDVDFYQVTRSAAEKNYGPDLYDFALMLVSPDGVKPDDVIKPAAQNVWKYYKEHRPDVKTKDIKPKEAGYSPDYKLDTDHEYEHTDKYLVGLINTVFFQERTAEFEKLLKKGQDLLGKYGVDMHELVKTTKGGPLDKYFNSKYYV
jgi:hypothetical protein